MRASDDSGILADLVLPPKHINAAVGVILLLSALLLAPAGRAAAAQTETEQSLLAFVNDVRAAHDLRPLDVDARLVDAARDHSIELLRANVFEHGSFAERI